MRALLSGSMGPSVLARGALEDHRGLGGSFTFSHTERPAALLVAWVEAGWQGESSAGAAGYPIPSLRRLAPWVGALTGRPRDRVSPQEAGRPDPPSVQLAVWQAEVRALASGSLDPRVLARGAFKDRRASEGAAHSPALNKRRHPNSQGGGGGQVKSSAGNRGFPIPGVVAPGPLGGVPRGLT